jgi:hypothetical protein
MSASQSEPTEPLRPYRFGVQIHSLATPKWQASIRLIESLGYSTVFLPDHFGK